MAALRRVGSASAASTLRILMSPSRFVAERLDPTEARRFASQGRSPISTIEHAQIGSRPRLSARAINSSLSAPGLT
jgi:hypothetical protein